MSLYVRGPIWLHLIAAALRPPLTEAEAVRRIVAWAARDGERYRAGRRS
jgi:hypothetical protein